MEKKDDQKKPKKTKAQIFRETATEDEWKKAVEDHKTMSKHAFKNAYGFCWQTIADMAAEKGYYEKRQRKATSANLSDNFIVSDFSREANFISRSVQLREDIYKRLKSFEAEKRQYTKTALLNQLLDSALKLYGF